MKFTQNIRESLNIDAAFLANMRPSNHGNTSNILLVEDNKSDVLLTKRILHNLSPYCYVRMIDTPRMTEALTLFEKTQFDLIILDLNLLDMEGSATVATLNAAAPHTPIIVQTASDSSELREESLTYGASHYIVKGSAAADSLHKIVHNSLTYSQPSQASFGGDLC